MLGKKKARTPETPPDHCSVNAMIEAAETQGWISGRELNFIPEILDIYKKAYGYFRDMAMAAEPASREHAMFKICRYLFAKGVEGVILWGASPEGHISVNFQPEDLLGDNAPVTEVPSQYRHLVSESLRVGESLFYACQDAIAKCQQKGERINLWREYDETLKWIPRLGISYGLFREYHLLEGSSGAIYHHKGDLSVSVNALLAQEMYPFLGTRSAAQNEMMLRLTRDHVLASAKANGLIDKLDFIILPASLEPLIELVGKLRDDLYRHHEQIQKQLQLPIINACFVYAFAKGAEFGFRWAEGERPPALNYIVRDALAGRAGAQVPQSQADKISKGMEIVWDVFCDFQDHVLKNPQFVSLTDGRELADLLACLFFWSSQVGTSYATNDKA